MIFSSFSAAVIPPFSKLKLLATIFAWLGKAQVNLALLSPFAKITYVISFRHSAIFKQA
jgi:hypothetical protein